MHIMAILPPSHHYLQYHSFFDYSSISSDIFMSISSSYHDSAHPHYPILPSEYPLHISTPVLIVPPLFLADSIFLFHDYA